MICDHRQRIFAALMPLLEDSLGIDRDELPHPDERIDEHLKRTGTWDDLEFFGLWFSCERTFGFSAVPEEFFGPPMTDPVAWERDVAPRLTYEALADFIAERAPVVSFDPVEIAGVRCAKAGAFLGLQAVGRGIGDGLPRFTPSTPIRDCLQRSELTELWSRLAWMSDSPPPPLRTRWVDRTWSLFVLACAGLFGGGIAAFALGVAAIFLHAFSFLKVTWTLLKLAERFENPLPEGVVTFGDLARSIAAAERTSAC